MKIAIHHRDKGFSSRWIQYCKINNLDFKVVDCYQSDIFEELKDCDMLLWHYHHTSFIDMICARKILNSMEHSGKFVFPDFKTGWHFDDKLSQMYLLQSIGAPMVKSYVFYDKSNALSWVKTAYFPKVFKLKSGAGSANVRLVNSKREAKRLISIAFGKGFSQFNGIENVKERIRKYKAGKDTLWGVFKGVIRMFISTKYAKSQANEKGYAYFQDFIPNNNYDIRVIVIGRKAIAIKRLTRANDFRASGSGSIVFDHEQINNKYIKIAFEINKKLQSQCVAYDFIQDENRQPLIVEISYGFSVLAYDSCMGYWTDDLIFHAQKVNLQYLMIEDLIHTYEKKQNSK